MVISEDWDQHTRDVWEPVLRRLPEAEAAQVRAGIDKGFRWRRDVLPLLIEDEYPRLLRDGIVEPADRFVDEQAWFSGMQACAEQDGLRIGLGHSWSSYRDDEVMPHAYLLSPVGEGMPRSGPPWGCQYVDQLRLCAERIPHVRAALGEDRVRK